MPVGPPPLGVGAPHRIFVTAHPGSSLAEATFAPAQPPFIVTELLGEKTNLTQKKPANDSPRNSDATGDD